VVVGRQAVQIPSILMQTTHDTQFNQSQDNPPSQSMNNPNDLCQINGRQNVITEMFVKQQALSYDSNAYMDKTLKWPQIKPDDGKGLSTYVLVLIGSRNTL